MRYCPVSTRLKSLESVRLMHKEVYHVLNTYYSEDRVFCLPFRLQIYFLQRSKSWLRSRTEKFT